MPFNGLTYRANRDEKAARKHMEEARAAKARGDAWWVSHHVKMARHLVRSARAYRAMRAAQ